MSYNAITYGWRNIKNGKMYIGYHKTSEIDDGYVFSSEDEEANEAWSYGELKRSIIYRGDQSIAITLENYLLKSVQAHKNPQYYNRSVGGGSGCVKDFSNLTSEIIKLGEDWIQGIEPIIETATSNVDTDDIKELKANITNGQYVIHERESVKKLFGLPRNQVRMNVHENEHAEVIAEKMKDNPEKARMHVSPIIIMVDDGIMQIIDGNHTILAAKLAGWKTIPAIYINSSEFKDKQCNVDYFGYLMNHEEKVKKPNSVNDLKRAIINFNETHEEYELGTEDFKEAFKDAYGEFWSAKQIASNMDSVKNLLATQEEIRKNNFKVYTKNELDSIARDLETKNPATAVISISSSSCYNAGIGAVLNKMGGMDVWKGIILISYRDVSDWTNRHEHSDKLNEAMKRIHPNAKINVEEVLPFVKTK